MRHPRSIDWRPVVMLCACLAMAACAIQDPPPGGPEDRKPPGIASTFPARDSAGVGALTEIRIEFDEGMKHDRLERQLRFYPNMVVRKARWEGNTLVIEPESLNPDTTYVIELASGFTDEHGVSNERAFRFAFATSAAIDSGSIEGRVYFRRKPSDKGVVRLFNLPKDSAFAPEAARPDREVTTDPDGTFIHRRLPTRQSRFVLWAFQDANGNRRFDAANEIGQVLEDTVLLTATSPTRRDIAIDIVDPTEPSQVSGRIINETGIDSFPVTLTLTSVTDTTPPSYLTRADLKGNYQFKPLMGRYVLRGFLDFGADSLCGSYPCPGDSNSSCTEPCSLYPDTIVVEPGAKLTLEDLVLESTPE